MNNQHAMYNLRYQCPPYTATYTFANKEEGDNWLVEVMNVKQEIRRIGETYGLEPTIPHGRQRDDLNAWVRSVQAVRQNWGAHRVPGDIIVEVRVVEEMLGAEQTF